MVIICYYFKIIFLHLIKRMKIQKMIVHLKIEFLSFYPRPKGRLLVNIYFSKYYFPRALALPCSLRFRFRFRRFRCATRSGATVNPSAGFRSGTALNPSVGFRPENYVYREFREKNISFFIGHFWKMGEFHIPLTKNEARNTFIR